MGQWRMSPPLAAGASTVACELRFVMPMLKTTVFLATCLALLAFTALLAAKSVVKEPVSQPDVIYFDAPVQTVPATIWR